MRTIPGQKVSKQDGQSLGHCAAGSVERCHLRQDWNDRYHVRRYRTGGN